MSRIPNPARWHLFLTQDIQSPHIDPFGGPRLPSFRAVSNTPLRVNPEQTPVFMLGSRRVDLYSSISIPSCSGTKKGRLYLDISFCEFLLYKTGNAPERLQLIVKTMMPLSQIPPHTLRLRNYSKRYALCPLRFYKLPDTEDGHACLPRPRSRLKIFQP